MIDANSRYYHIGRAVHVTGEGRPVAYLKRRLPPQSRNMAMMAAITVIEGMRLDLIAARLQGNPLLSWRIADANDALNPFDLTQTPGHRLRIPKPRNINEQ